MRFGLLLFSVKMRWSDLVGGYFGGESDLGALGLGGSFCGTLIVGDILVFW